ncbi:PepSY domain-containing protein [Methylocella silvestris]|uniref:PepSY domain-containing protein n=1 Tax=Methylocella silvestris TaxID=199596 RepID=UPI001FDFB984|nr:PepSY domain-containing protein [Methylocella silvestris]
MKYAFFAAILVVTACLGPAPVAARQICSVPLADWQPRETLQKKLEAEGWTVVSIRSDDGCYKIKATRAGGERLEAKYDPASLERVRREQEEDDD